MRVSDHQINTDLSWSGQGASTPGGGENNLWAGGGGDNEGGGYGATVFGDAPSSSATVHMVPSQYSIWAVGQGGDGGGGLGATTLAQPHHMNGPL